MKRILAENIYKSIKGVEILKAANMELESGEICALIGPNGAGKTTLIKCLLGLMKIDTGKIEINGVLLDEKSRVEILPYVGAVLQYPEYIAKMTIKEFFKEHFFYLSKEPVRPIEEILQEVELNVSLETKIKELSLGMKQRLLLASALSHNPNILVLDEPFNGLDVDGIVTIKTILKRLHLQGTTILIASHSLKELEDVATSTIFIMNGKTESKKYMEDILCKCEGGLQQYYQALKKGVTK